MNRSDFQELAEVRISEAVALLSGSPPMPDGAYYLAGYAVECALKACIAKLVREHDWPEKEFVNKAHTHDLSSLARQAALETARENEAKTNPAFAANWIVVKDWNERSRYERHSLTEAKQLVEAVDNPENGVLPWIEARW